MIPNFKIVTEISSLHQGLGEALPSVKALPQGQGAMHQGTASFRAAGRRGMVSTQRAAPGKGVLNYQW
jgi:hypothetical protein